MKKNIKIVTILMSIALIGIIGFQAFWIRDSYRKNLVRFDKDVKRALVSSINMEKTIRYLASRPNVYIKYNGNLPVFLVDSTGVIENKSNQQSSQDNYVITGEYSADGLAYYNKDSTKVTMVESVKEWSIKDNSGGKIFFDQTQTIAELRVDIEGERVYNYLYEKIITPNAPIYSQVNYSHLDSIYRQELDRLDINTPFVMGSWNTHSQSFDYINNEEANLKSLIKGYSVYINPDDFLNSEVLLTNFPGKTGFIVKKLGGTLFASLLMILITLGSFGFALYTIFNQKRLSEIKNDFIGNMTHELKTPISTVSLAIEALQNFDVLKDKKRTKQYLDISNNENARLGMMVEKVLKISAFEKKEIKLSFESTDTHHLIQQITKNVEVQINNKGGHLYLDLSSENFYIEADQVHLTNVIYNLIDNAIKYSPEKPEITVFTKDHGHNLMIGVQDRGIGIASHHQKKIYDKFYRVPTGNVHNIKGYGLGLSYVADIVKKHNGVIKLESEPGKGSLFKIFLPLLREKQKNLKLS